MVCGTSMGAQVGGMVALQYTLDGMMDKLDEFYVRGYFRALYWDLTFPFLAMLTGEAFLNRLKRMFGSNTDIEDMYIPFFAVSANLTTRHAQIHDSGKLWHACRCSSSLPLILPPVVTPDGLLMDGGLINNVPIDLCRQYGADIIVSVDVSDPGMLVTGEYSTHVSGFKMLWDRYLSRRTPFSSGFDMLLYLTQMVDAATKPKRQEESDLHIRPDVQGFGLLEWSVESQNQLVQRGYSSALTAIQRMKNENPNLYNAIVQQAYYDPSFYAQSTRKSNNNWRRISIALVALLIILAGRRYNSSILSLLGKLKEIFASVLDLAMDVFKH